MENENERIILSTLNDIDELNYIDKIINSFSYADRLKTFNKFCFDKNTITKYSSVSGRAKYILTEDEIVKIIRDQFAGKTVNDMLDSSKKRYLLYLFNSINIDNKVEEFLNLDKTLMIYTCNDIFNTDELRAEFIDKIEKTEDNYDFLSRVVNSIISNIKDFDLKLKCIDKIISISPNIYLSNMISNIKESDFKHCFNDLGLSEFTKSLLVLKCINSKIAKEYFFKLDDFSKINASSRFRMSYIDSINSFLGENEPLLDDNFTIEDIKEMLFSFKDQNKRVLMLSNYEDNEKYKFLPFLSEEEKITLLSDMDDPKIFFKGLNYLNGILSISRVLTFYKGEFPKYNESFKKLLISYSKIYGVNIEHLVEMSKATSLEIIKSLANKNIKLLINMDDDSFNRFISFFSEDNTKLTEYTLNNIFDAFANKSFNLNYEYIMHYYTNVILYCQQNDKYAAKEIIKKIFHELDEDLTSDYSIDSLYDALTKSDPVAMKRFHSFCNEYINVLRKKEIEISVNMYKDEYLDEMYEASSSIKAIMEYCDYEWISDHIFKMMDEFTQREKSLIEDKTLFKQIYEFKLKPVSSPPPIIKTNMFVFNKIMDKFYSVYRSDDKVLHILRTASIKRVPVIPDVDSKFLIDIMSKFDADEIKTRLLCDEGLCKDLNKALKKYSFLAFNNRFESIQLDADTYCDAETVSSIFLNYRDIIKTLKKANVPLSMSSILDSADTYNNSSKIYKEIFEEDNFELITLNPPLNRANSLRKERRETSLANYIKCYTRNEVAVPSFDENMEVNSKKINVVVGNFTNPINLTLGERTGSCMRSGGVGDDLYNFCLTDSNGFHIVFSKPDTGEFISRVSGFRNGNTVFLNQLRESVLNDYNSEDLRQIMKKVSDKIINMSKDSEHPIDNIVISHDKVMEDYECETVNLGISNIFKGLTKSFWFDIIPNNSILLSSSNNGELVPVKLGKNDISYYPVQRDKVKFASNPTEAVNHIEVIDQLLLGKKLEEIKESNKEYKICYYGEDWYISIDNDENIHKKVMSKSKDFDSAFREMDMVYRNIQEVEEIFESDENKLYKK